MRISTYIKTWASEIYNNHECHFTQANFYSRLSACALWKKIKSPLKRFQYLTSSENS